jgi:hypothetical protein
MTIFYCLRFETPPTWRARSPYLYPPGTGWPSYTLRYWVPFSSSPTTRRGYLIPPPHGQIERYEYRISLLTTLSSCSSIYSLGMDRIENTSPDSFSVVTSCSYRMDRTENTASQLIHRCVLRICFLATGVSADFTVLSFSKYAPLCIYTVTFKAITNEPRRKYMNQKRFSCSKIAISKSRMTQIAIHGSIEWCMGITVSPIGGEKLDYANALSIQYLLRE